MSFTRETWLSAVMKESRKVPVALVKKNVCVKYHDPQKGYPMSKDKRSQSGHCFDVEARLKFVERKANRFKLELFV